MPKSHKLKLISLDHFEIQVEKISSFLSSGKFCHLLINSANNLGPDQDGQNVCPDVGPYCLTL